jgi:ubiquinone/menaquinone biosynthesis C-methylase UbiE
MDHDIQQFDHIARTIFAPAYPVIAEQIISRTGVTRGVCLDIGCGGGYLGAALARTTDLSVYFFDKSADMLAIAARTIAENGLENRSTTLHGEVTAIVLEDESVDLVVSRGSIFFWDDLPRAFSEIHRVLATGGWAYIGGGFGSRAIKEDIERQMDADRQRGERFRARVRRNLGPETREQFETALNAAGITCFSIVHSEEIGLWLVMRKTSSVVPRRLPETCQA